eukprot:CAMPEP_0118915454 /NCGR_PEP_ID=MMETSP1166-20130328/15621_1 /TAXON_ID=1104430 /ORGANISM="Chrysoreinhardia sp, Strain CCMP3193" /LENGTH=393 /DNA_ID=CAMNT_0006855151 /DNA_START=18 /DNA_END=1199 /DNA_ORIENTATION=+
MSKVVEKKGFKYVQFGRSELKVSELCVGSMTWGSFNGDEEEAFAQLDKFWEAGANFIDTAELYPVAYNYGETTEKWIGNWMKARKIDRSKIYLATKVNPAGVGSSDPPEKHSFEAERVLQACKLSLERLGTDYIDLYQYHFPSRLGFAAFGWGSYGSPERYAEAKTSEGDAKTFDRQVLAVKQLFDLGLIKDWGLSNENAYGVTMICTTCDRLGVPRPVSIQNDFSLNNRTYENDVLEAALEFGVVGLPYGALAGGVLTAKYDDPKYAGDRPLDLARHNAKPDFQGRYNNPNSRRAAQEYKALAEEWGLKPVELAYAWANTRAYNASVITGTTTIGQCDDAIEAFKIHELPAELIAKIDQIHEKFRSPTAALVDKPYLTTTDIHAPAVPIEAK